jgi:hypothetical protein
MISMLIEFERTGRPFYLSLAMLFYALDIHTHERFATMIIVIIPLILTSKYLGSRSKALWSGAFALPLIFNLCMKKYLFHMPLLVGTGSAYSLGFTWKTAFQFFVQAILNVFGISNGPAELDGIVFQELSGALRVASIALFVVSILVLAAGYVVGSRICKTSLFEPGPRRFIFFGVLTLCVLTMSVSVTIRVEPRFVFPPTMVFLLLMAYCLSLVIRQRNVKVPAVIMFLLLVTTSLTLNKVYSNNEANVYFMSARAQARQIVEFTVVKVGRQIASRPVYVIDPTEGADWQSVFGPTISANSNLGAVTISTVHTLLDVPFDDHPIVYDMAHGLHTLNVPPKGYLEIGDWYGDWAGRKISIVGSCRSLKLTIRPFRPGLRFHVVITTRGQKTHHYPLHANVTTILLSGKQFGGALDATFNRLYVPALLGLGPETHDVAARVVVNCAIA